MRKIDIKKAFIRDCFNGNKEAYKKARKDDYCKVQLEWAFYIDSLCRNGEITLKQYETVEF